MECHESRTATNTTATCNDAEQPRIVLDGPASPMVHAIGGSLGSAIALFVFYPLERLRVELQSKHNSSVRKDDVHDDGNRSKTDNGGDVADDGMDEKRYAEPCETRAREVKEREVEADSSSGSKESSFELLRRNSSRTSASSSSMEDDEDDVWYDPPPNQKAIKETTVSPPKNTSPSQGLWPTFRSLYKRNELYRGAPSYIFTLALSNFVFFYAHELTKSMLHPDPSYRRDSPLKALLASTFAGILNVIITNPLWVANMRILQNNTQLDRKSLWTELLRIAQSEGVAQLWNGTTASLLLVSNPAIQHFLYGQMRSRFLRQRRRGGAALRPLQAFLLGAVAKAVATVVTYPLQLAQVLLRLRQRSNDLPYKSTLDCLCILYKQNGIPAMYKGMNAKLLQTVLTAAFTFLTYEQIIAAVQVGTRMAFSCKI